MTFRTQHRTLRHLPATRTAVRVRRLACGGILARHYPLNEAEGRFLVFARGLPQKLRAMFLDDSLQLLAIAGEVDQTPVEIERFLGMRVTRGQDSGALHS